MAGGNCVVGSYFAQHPENPDEDFEFPLATLITQHLSVADALERSREIEADVRQCAAVLEKYHLMTRDAESRPMAAARLVGTELEYLLTLIRSMYDLLQCLVRDLSSRLIDLDDGRKLLTKQLPSSFREMVLQEKRLLSADDIISRRGVPRALADWYVREAPVFELLRAIRDSSIHRGASLPTILVFPDRGLGVGIGEWPWSKVSAQTPLTLISERHMSMRGFFAWSIRHVLDATTRFEQVIRANVRLPAAIGDGIRVFVRSPMTFRLVELERTIQSPWEFATDEA
jgi:hypothetical protein